MKNHPWFLAILGLVGGFIVFLFALVTVELPGKDTTNANAGRVLTPLERPTVTFADPSKGPKDAPVTIVEFADFQCEPCAVMAMTLDEILRERPRQVRVVWKDLPDPTTHPLATSAARAARCAEEQGAFWQYHDALFTAQAGLQESFFPDIAAAVGIDRATFEACMVDARTGPLVERSAEEGLRLGVTATPTLFINDRRIVGAVGKDALIAAIEEALRK